MDKTRRAKPSLSPPQLSLCLLYGYGGITFYYNTGILHSNTRHKCYLHYNIIIIQKK